MVDLTTEVATSFTPLKLVLRQDFAPLSSGIVFAVLKRCAQAAFGVDLRNSVSGASSHLLRGTKIAEVTEPLVYVSKATSIEV